MPKKSTYRIRNWSHYNNALRQRGSLTVWISQDTVKTWYVSPNHSSKKPGRPQQYSDVAIECCLTIKSLFKLPLRATQGFINSLFELLQLPLRAPDYSLISLRQKKLRLQLPKQSNNHPDQAIHLVVDSTGLKLYGEGEWKVRQHGKDKKRTWHKLHLGIDQKSHDIQACLMTDDNVHDSEALPALLEQIDVTVEQVTGDGAYDNHPAYCATLKKQAVPCFPPRKNAVRHEPSDEAWRLRNHAVSQVIYYGLSRWKKNNNYHRRSLAETAMYRFKKLFGQHIQARTSRRQAIEIGIKCKIINRMNSLGMPTY